MTSSNFISPDLGHLSDDASLLRFSPNTAYDPYQDSPQLEDDESAYSPEVETYSFLESGSKQGVRNAGKASPAYLYHRGFKGALVRKLPPSKFSTSKENIQLRELEPRPEKNHDIEFPGAEERSEAATIPSFWGKLLDVTQSVLLLIATVSFYAVLGYVMSLNDKAVDEEVWTAIQNFQKILVNIFPVFFSSLMCRTTRKLAAWKLERGCSLIFLEQLMGSNSFISAVLTFFSLGARNLLWLFIPLMWTMSELGGASSLRLLTLETSPHNTTFNVSYLDTGSEGTWIDTDDTFAIPDINALYAASLFQPLAVQTSPIDLWGNIKIPDLIHTSKSANNTDWTEVSGNETAYSSLLGIPISAVPNQGNNTFNIETSYMAVSCKTVSTSPQAIYFSSTDLEDVPSVPGFWGPKVTFLDSSGSKTNYTFSLALNQFSYRTDQIIISEIVLPVPDVYFPTDAGTLLFQSLVADPSGRIRNSYSYAYCPLTTAYVECRVFCISSNCSVTAVRPSTMTHPPANLTNLVVPTQFGRFASNLIVALAPAANSYTTSLDSISSVTELFLQDPNFAKSAGNVANLSLVSADDLSIRLEQVLNTYWQASLPGMLSSDPEGGKWSNGTNFVPLTVFRCHWLWSALYFAATTTLFLAGVAGVALSILVRGPEVLGFCASLTRTSKYIEQPGKSRLGGVKRARELKGLRLRLADVAGDRRIGQIAIVKAEAVNGETVVPLRKRRLYS